MTPAVPLPASLLALSVKVGDMMDHTPESAYAHLRDTRPSWFLTPPGEGGISIVHWPMTEGQVVYRDQWWILLQDPVVFPDGTPGRYLRMLAPHTDPAVAVLPVLDEGKVVLIEHFRHATRSWHWEIPRGGGSPGLDGEENAAKELQEEVGASPRELISLGTLHPDTGILASEVELYAARIDAVGDLESGEGVRRARTVSFAEAEQMAESGRITDAFTIAALFRARRAGLAA
ncbi:NUDIX hydrolase (plasmid) [Streptomyces sp. NBC_01298]|uniref:NUDIX hydrolase n=1 Tax=Streptomyces sp. NBC_01298 TaxID=2903817 RepID=UPI002E1004B2|nr:NUDIX hydrolase [Streptomyces sp. NBC_01298]WSK25937.1 NUDIX hydrolase [Streptomyces sp. NBC_01298]